VPLDSKYQFGCILAAGMVVASGIYRQNPILSMLALFLRDILYFLTKMPNQSVLGFGGNFWARLAW